MIFYYLWDVTVKSLKIGKTAIVNHSCTRRNRILVNYFKSGFWIQVFLSNIYNNLINHWRLFITKNLEFGSKFFSNTKAEKSFLEMSCISRSDSGIIWNHMENFTILIMNNPKIIFMKFLKFGS